MAKTYKNESLSSPLDGYSYLSPDSEPTFVNPIEVTMDTQIMLLAKRYRQVTASTRRSIQ